jgi:hypothetical protein
VGERDGTKVCGLPHVVGDIREWLPEFLRQLVRTHRPVRQRVKDLATKRMENGLGGDVLLQEPSLRKPDSVAEGRYTRE